MHILLGILGAVAAAVFVIYRIFWTVEAGREVADKIGDPRRFVRKFQWWRKVKGNPVERLEDPREAATVLMLAVARTEDDLSDAARAAIQAQMRRRFQMSEADAESMFRQIAWMTREMIDVNPRMRRLVAPLRHYCTQAERREMVAMMEEVATACGGLTPLRRQIIQQYQRILREQDE